MDELTFSTILPRPSFPSFALLSSPFPISRRLSVLDHDTSSVRCGTTPTQRVEPL